MITYRYIPHLISNLFIPEQRSFINDEYKNVFEIHKKMWILFVISEILQIPQH